jgi:hypothetical protein
MNNSLTTIDGNLLAAACGGTVVTSPWAQFETDLKGRIDSQIAAARTRLDHITPPTMPTIPSQPTTKYSHCFPTPNAQS